MTVEDATLLYSLWGNTVNRRAWNGRPSVASSSSVVALSDLVDPPSDLECQGRASCRASGSAIAFSSSSGSVASDQTLGSHMYSSARMHLYSSAGPRQHGRINMAE